VLSTIRQDVSIPSWGEKMVKTALVTGAYGFLGRYVARQLARDGWRVIGLGHGSWARDEWKEWGIDEWHAAEVTLESLVTYGSHPDVILHCAGSGSVSFSMSHPFQDFQRTVTTTMAVLEYARLYAPQAKIAYPSSAGVYGVVQKFPIAETDSFSPASPYGVHKRIAEEMCESYARHFGVSVAVVRLFSVYGSGLRKQLLWDASQKITRGERIFFGTGDEIRDWLHVEDAARLLIKVAEHASAQCPIVNGCSGQGVSVREILTELFDNFGITDKPEFSGVKRDGDPVGYVGDISKVLALGWRPMVELRKGLSEYVQWFKSCAQ
jgi:UDP-glucose 4-epimerase